MSADNWADCPRCYRRARAEYDRLLVEMAGNYGKIPLADFEQARAALKEPQPDNFTTFREDYEIYGAVSGVVTVDYGGMCETCGLSLSFVHEHEIPEVTS